MVSKKIAEKAAQARKDGYIVLNLEGGPVRLSYLMEFALEIFPNHDLSRLAITQAEEDQFVIAAELSTGTLPN